MTLHASSALRAALAVLAGATVLAAQALPTNQTPAPSADEKRAPEPPPTTPWPERPQSATELPPLPDAAAFAPGAKLPDRVLHDERDGSLWALGHDYKASFDASGMTFIPYFGAAAPHNFPVRFTVASIQRGEEQLPIASQHAPRRDGDRIRIERGPCVEVFDLGLRAIEQSFVFAPMPATGDLCVRLRARTELTLLATATGLAFRGEHGSVTYEHAVVFDGAGRRRALAIERAGGDEFVLRVPQQFLASATGPITIDPLVATFFPATGTPVDFHPDVAFVAGGIVTTWQRVWSATDHDVFVEWRAAGVVQAIDFTGENWEDPRIAADAASARVLVVAQVGQPWLQRVVKGRTASSTAVAPTVQISGTEAGEAIHCDVGGDPSGAPGTMFCIVWEHALSAGDRNVLFRTMNPVSQLFGSSFSMPLDTSTRFDTRPRIAKTCGPAAAGGGQFWPVVWQRRFSPTDEDVFGALVGAGGSVILPTFVVDFSGANDTNPVVSSPTVPFAATPFAGGRAFLVAYERTMAAGGRNVHARVFSGSVGLTATTDLSTLGNPATAPGFDQFAPSVDCDGLRFVVAHCERDPFAPTADNNSFVATWKFNGLLAVHEAPRLLNSSQFGLPEVNPRVANAPGTTLHAVVFERVNAALTDRDVFGATFDSNLAAVPFRVGGCLVPGALFLSGPGTPVFPGSTVGLMVFAAGNVTAPIIAVGPPAVPFPGCIGCLVGVDMTSASITVGTTSTLVIPTDPRLVGTSIAAQSLGDFLWSPFVPVGMGCAEYPLTYSAALVIPIN